MHRAVTSLILPGLGNSGPEHSQTHFERADPGCIRVLQDEWEAPDCADWVARLDETIRSSDWPVRLVGHSSSCALVAHWALVAAGHINAESGFGEWPDGHAMLRSLTAD